MCQYQQFHPCSDVHILSAVCHGTSNAEILVVEEIHDNSSTGKIFCILEILLTCNKVFSFSYSRNMYEPLKSKD